MSETTRQAPRPRTWPNWPAPSPTPRPRAPLPREPRRSSRPSRSLVPRLSYSRSRPLERTRSSGFRAEPSSPPTTRSSTPTRCVTSSSATSRAPDTRPRATPRPPAGSGSAWRPPAPARRTSSRRSPTPHGLGADRRDHRPGSSGAIGTDAFQEADIRGITMPITKHNYLVTDADEIPRVDRRGVPHRRTGRPGPVLVDIAKDALQAQTTSPGRRRSTCPATAR